MPSAASAPASPPSTDGGGAPPGSPAGRALALVAWPLAVLGPVGICVVAAGVVDGMLPDERPEGECRGLGFGCTLTIRETVGLYGTSAAGPVIVLLVGVGALVARGMPTQGRFRAVVVMLAAEALLAALVGITIVRIANDLA